MASLQSYIDDAANIATSADGRTITITGDCNIDGALDALPHIDDGVHIIIGAGGKLRSSAGASGTLGGGRVPLRITEQATSHAYGQDNGNGQATDCRFGPGATNTLVYDFIIWEMEGRTTGRSDFDVPASAGVEFYGVRLVQKWITGGQIHFNHIWGSSPKLRENPRCGYALSIRNETNAHGIELVGTMNSLFDTLLVDNVDIAANTRNEGATKGSSARVVVKPTGTMTLTGLDTETITESNDGSTNLVQLINPKRIPTRTANWSSNDNNGYGSRMEILRDVAFDFMGADNATGTLYADSQASSNGQDASAPITSGGAATVRVRTHWSPHATGTWTDTDSYQFYACGLGFDKYYSGPTNIAVGTNPSTRSVNIMTTELPDGTATTSKTGGAVETAADIVNALKTYEVANPTYPSVSTRLVVVASGVVRVSTAELVLSTTASDFLARSGNTITLQCDSGGVGASNGVELLNLGSSYNAPSGTLNLINLPTTTSTGTSALVNVTAPQSFLSLYTSAGANLGTSALASAGTWSKLIPANQAAADTKVGCGRKGYVTQNRSIDISAGGTFNVEFQDLVEEVDPEGNALYDSAANKTGISVAFTSTGQPTIGIPNRFCTPKQIYRALHDQYNNPLGAKFAAFGRQPISYTIDPLSGDNLYLGADTQLRRSTNSGGNARVQAAVYGGRGGVPVNGDRGDVTIKPGSNIERIQEALLTDFDLDTGTPETQSVAGLLVKINECSSKMEPAVNNIISQLKLICQSLPRHYYAPWTPGNPAVFFMRGQQRLHDVNKRNWGISNPDGNLLIEPVTGYGDFDGETRVEASLNRGAGDDIVNYAEECTLAYRIKPLDEDGTFILNEMGAMRLRLVMSGGDGALKVGHSGDNDYTHATIKAGKWNDIVLSIQRNPDNANYPFVRLSATDGGYDGNSSPGVKAVQTWNTSSNDVFGSIASHTGAFYIGATSNGFKGQVSSCYFHPSETALNYVWETGDHKRAVGWDDYHQIWNGLPGDNSEGLSDDIVEDNVIRALAQLVSILEKLNHADIANAVLTQPFRAGWDATKADTDALGNFIKWLAANVNTTTPPAAPTKTSLGLPDNLEEDITELKEKAKVTAGVVAGRSTITKQGKRTASSTFYDLDDSEEAVRTITYGDDDGQRTASETPDP